MPIVIDATIASDRLPSQFAHLCGTIFLNKSLLDESFARDRKFVMERELNFSAASCECLAISRTPGAVRNLTRGLDALSHKLMLHRSQFPFSEVLVLV